MFRVSRSQIMSAVLSVNNVNHYMHSMQWSVFRSETHSVILAKYCSRQLSNSSNCELRKSLLQRTSHNSSVSPSKCCHHTHTHTHNPLLHNQKKTRLPCNLRLTTCKCMHLVTHGNFQSCDTEGSHTIRSAIAKNHRAACKLHGSYSL